MKGCGVMSDCLEHFAECSFLGFPGVFLLVGEHLRRFEAVAFSGCSFGGFQEVFFGLCHCKQNGDYFSHINIIIILENTHV